MSEQANEGPRLQRLLDAVLLIGSELELQIVLQRIVEAAVALVDAEYGALGVVAVDEEGLSQFITVGIDAAGIAEIGPYPRGQGLLGELIRDPQPLRLDRLGDHPVSYGFPPNHPPMNSFLGVPIRVRTMVFGNLYLTEKRGGAPFDAEDEAVVKALATAAGVAIANARLYDESRQRETWLQATARVSTALLGGSETDEVLGLVADGAREVIGADFALLALPGPNGQLVAEATSGVGAPEHTGSPLGSDRIEEAFASATPRELPGLQLSGRTFGAGLMAPLATSGSARGILLVGRVSGERFGAEALRTLTAFSAQAALVLEVADRRRDGERLVVFEDRDRIARDLHDLVIQRLFATGMQLESATRFIVSAPEEAQQRVHRAVDDLDLTIKEIRSTIYALQTPVGSATTMRARLLEVVDAAAEQLGYSPALRLGGLLDTNVPTAVADHAVAVLREGLSNAARHSGASRVEVEVRVEESTGDGLNELVVVVRDDGRGLSSEGRRSGLSNLAERAELLGGVFRVGPGSDGAGTELNWRVPLPD